LKIATDRFGKHARRNIHLAQKFGQTQNRFLQWRNFGFDQTVRIELRSLKQVAFLA